MKLSYFARLINDLEAEAHEREIDPEVFLSPRIFSSRANDAELVFEIGREPRVVIE